MRNTLVWTFLVCGASAAAQERIDTDRPDQTESAVLVPATYFQGELGFGKENFGYNHYNLIHPEFLFKYGLSKRFELRLASAWLSESIPLIPDPKTVRSLEAVEIGSKIALFEEKGWRPKTSVIIHLATPLSDRDIKGGRFYPSFRLTSQHSISPALALGYNLGWLNDEDGRSWLYTFAPGLNMGKRWYGYTELFGFYRTSSTSGATGWTHTFDTGVAYYLTDNVKLDFSSGFGIKPNPMKNYVAIGCSFRVPFGVQQE